MVNLLVEPGTPEPSGNKGKRAVEIRGLIQWLFDLLEIFNVKDMPVHDRKDILFVIVSLTICCIMLKSGWTEEAKYAFFLVLIFSIIRSALHPFHYEGKRKKTNSERLNRINSKK